MTSKDGRRQAPTPVLPLRAGRAPKPLLAALGLALAAACLAAAGFATGALRIERRPELLLEGPGGRRIAALPLPEGRFVHSYIHSIHHSRVDEYFRIEGSLLRLYELRYDTNSVGMPSDAEGGFRLEGGRFVLQMDRSFERIPIMVSHIPGHGIVVGGRLLPFTDWVPIEESLVLEARTRYIVTSKFHIGR